VTSQAAQENSSSQGGRRRGKIRSSHWYALLGSLLGITYFIIGPLMSLIRWEKISCGGNDYLDITELREGTQAVGDGLCKAQRVAPFVLQAIFNLMLYALMRVLITVDQRFKQWSPTQVDMARYGGMIYGIFGPIVCMGIALGLDSTSGDIIILFGQLARQTSVCSMRLTTAQEVILVFMPFIITGCAITLLSLYIYFRLNAIQAGVKELTSGNRSSDRALRLLMVRLSVLGIATFIVIIILIATTGYVISSMDTFSPLFNAWFTCETTSSSCKTLAGDCEILRTQAYNASPHFTVYAVQIAAMSCISLLLSGFFAAQALPRFIEEIRSGALVQKLDNIIEGRPLHYHLGNASSVQPDNVKSASPTARGMPAASRATGKVLSANEPSSVAAYMEGDIGQSPVYAREISNNSKKVTDADD